MLFEHWCSNFIDVHVIWTLWGASKMSSCIISCAFYDVLTRAFATAEIYKQLRNTGIH